MSRLNYRTDEELALDGIEQELRLLERQVADGAALDGSQLQTLAEYRDRISRLVASFQSIASDHSQNQSVLQSEPLSTDKASKPESEDLATSALRKSIRKCLGEGMV